VDLSVAALRRYPVKSMGGEHLERVTVDARGLVGDRWYAVVDDDGRLASGKDTRRFRRRDAVFEHRAAMTGDGVVVDDRWRVGDPMLDRQLSEEMGAAVRLAPEADVPHQDQGSVSLVGSATLRWCAERWGIDADPRRLRVNVVVETDEPFVEESWVGHELTVGGVRLAVVQRVERCRTVDLAQDGASGRGAWLKPLAAEREMCVAVYADVRQPGLLAVGDVVDV